MLKDYSPIVQALLGTLFTWALTAAGAALVIVIRGKQVSFLFLYFLLQSNIFEFTYISSGIYYCINQNVIYVRL